jgi:hypothetical protein
LFDFEPASDFPWPDTDFDVTFRAEPKMVTGARGTIAVAQTATVRGPARTGRRGVRLTLRSTPRTRAFVATRIRVGRRVSVIGSTLPALRNVPVSLFVSDGHPRYFKRAATVRTDARGRFKLALRARHTGHLEVMARIKPRSARYAPDHTCPLGFDVRK